MHDLHAILARLDKIVAAIGNGTVANKNLTDRLTSLERTMKAMTDSTKAVLDAFTAELNTLTSKAGADAAAAKDLAEVLAQLQTLTATIHAANNPS